MTASDLALHLAANIHLLAKHESAGQAFQEIHHAVDTIDRVINRPVPARYCGPCPALLTDGSSCDTALLTDRKNSEVTCWSCKTLHNIDSIEAQLWERVDEWLLTPHEIHLVMEYFGEPLPPSTFRRWRASGRLQPRGHRDGKPRYWPKDIRALRNRAS